MENLPSNSIKQREKPKKQLKPVVTGKVKTRKKPLPKKFAETMLGTDLRTARTTFINDYVVPSIRDLISEGFHNFIDTLFGMPTGTSRRRAVNSHTSYEKYYYKSSNSSQNKKPVVANTRSPYEVVDVIIPDLDEAKRVLDELQENISEFGCASVNDYYELVGQTNELGSSTDPDHGWTDLDNVRISRVGRGRDVGYIIDLPRTEPLK